MTFIGPFILGVLTGIMCAMAIAMEQLRRHKLRSDEMFAELHAKDDAMFAELRMEQATYRERCDETLREAARSSADAWKFYIEELNRIRGSVGLKPITMEKKWPTN